MMAGHWERYLDLAVSNPKPIAAGCL